MLAAPTWVPGTPIPLNAVKFRLSFSTFDDSTGRTLLEAGRKRHLPWTESSERFGTYSAALEQLAKPMLFDNLLCYRLRSAQLTSDPPTVDIGLTHFFSGIDESELLAHEFAKWQKSAEEGGRKVKLQVRKLVGDPFHGMDRHVIFSISCLTMRVEGGTASFYLHSRDAKAVAIAGSLLHLAPSGVFQPTSDNPETVRRDANPWLTLCREFAEEFLGVEEARGEAGMSLSYDHDQPYAAINDAYRDGAIRVYACGLGLDPLTFCPELVTIACVDSIAFDELFNDLVLKNDEGFLRGRSIWEGRVQGYELREQTVHDLLHSSRLSPAANAALETAWLHRSLLIGTT